MKEDISELELSTQLIIEEAWKRGIQVEVLDAHDNFIRLRKGDKTEFIKQATRTSLDTYIAPLIMENKQVTKLVLSEAGIRVPNGFTLKSVAEALEKYEALKGTSIVIKPNSTNFGIGISMIQVVKDFEAFAWAVHHAFEHDDSILIEEWVRGREYRILVIGHEAAAVLYRVPANVKGDGVQTIQQLVDEKNLNPLRGVGYVKPLEKLKLGEVEIEFLKAQGMHKDTIPSAGETVYLRENSNISTGGDSIDYTDELHPGYKQIAVQAAQTVGAQICGVDMIINDMNSEPSNGQYSIIELNFNPALHIHNYPYHGTNRDVEKKVLDLLKLC